MLPKPPECLGCPLYQSGRGFTPDERVESALVAVVGQNPGRDEEREGRPFVGRTGEALFRDYAPLAGLERGGVTLMNALRCRWAGGNDLPPERLLAPALAHCTRAHFRLPASTRLVVAQGALAARLLGCPGSVSDWRGFLTPDGVTVDDAGRLVA